MKAEDKNFILASFLRGVYYGDSWFSQIPKSIFMDNYHKVAQVFVNSDKFVIKIACLPEDENVILGYSILSADYQGIVWVFVKSAWRNRGIGKSLVPKYPTYVTHLSKLGKDLIKKFNGCQFNPFKT